MTTKPNEVRLSSKQKEIVKMMRKGGTINLLSGTFFYFDPYNSPFQRIGATAKALIKSGLIEKATKDTYELTEIGRTIEL